MTSQGAVGEPRQKTKGKSYSYCSAFSMKVKAQKKIRKRLLVSERIDTEKN